MQVDCLCVDPPYGFSDKLQQSDVARGAESNYKIMSINDIKSLPVAKLAKPDGAILALWVPSSLLQEGLDIMKEWGFKHKQTYIWVKTKKSPLESFKKWVHTKVLKHPQIVYDKFAYDRAINVVKENMDNVDLNDSLAFGMGRLFRNCHEICLIGINNNGIYKKLKNKSQRTVSFAPNFKHSKKPEDLQDSLELMFKDSKIEFLELFARRERDGWVCLGNQVGEKLDIRESIEKLLT